MFKNIDAAIRLIMGEASPMDFAIISTVTWESSSQTDRLIFMGKTSALPLQKFIGLGSRPHRPDIDYPGFRINFVKDTPFSAYPPPAQALTPIQFFGEAKIEGRMGQFPKMPKNSVTSRLFKPLQGLFRGFADPNTIIFRHIVPPTS
jgi:hypothetical protein